ncbi:hypothetical protein NECAME_00183 [Necator americanus]|uniref:Uncharacterized protein n=1 Tax=Necator americanus TaxID=51031 RepID=W2TJ74_NECAM|nr:hypothetical protein NECAME_00183 [Necator americanus]ETN81833.1 hypothetical protein NECAME_00183 [Necator americanus]
MNISIYDRNLGEFSGSDSQQQEQQCPVAVITCSSEGETETETSAQINGSTTCAVLIQNKDCTGLGENF